MAVFDIAEPLGSSWRDAGLETEDLAGIGEVLRARFGTTEVPVRAPHERPPYTPAAWSMAPRTKGPYPFSFSIMISRMVRSVSTIPGVLTRPMLRMAASGVAPQMPSVAWSTTPSMAR